MDILNKRGSADVNILNKRKDVYGTAGGAVAEPTKAKSVKDWLNELDDALTREKDYRKSAKAIVELYEGDKKRDYNYNILYSNTDTLAPALYNVVPRPVVKRRFDDADPVAAGASKITQRTLEYFLDDGMGDLQTFDDLMQAAVLSALVPGRGVTFFKYDAKIVSTPAEEAAEGVQETLAEESVEGETVCGEEIPWDRIRFGYAKRWSDVPWLAIEDHMTKQEVRDNFPDLADKIIETMAADAEENAENAADKKAPPLATIFRVWDKSNKKVIFVSKEYKDEILKETDDPYNLPGFFPCPRPLGFIRRISSLIPLPLYKMYEEQARELNNVSVRINKIVAALKVRGGYDAQIENFDRVLKADDNELVALSNIAALGNNGTLDKAIMLLPIEKLVAVLQQLYVQRQQVKTVIFEITGIADIMRGSTQASETLGAQQIKNQWGTLRLKKAQKEVSRYVRDCLRIMAQIAMSKFSQKTLQDMTMLPFPTEQEKQMAQMQVQMLQQQAAQQAAMQPGQPPQPPQIPPQLSEVLKQPSWEQCLAGLKDNITRSYRIDIETNSTVDAEATEDKENIGELLNALAQYLNGVQPLVEAGSLPFEAAQGMMLAIVRRYRFGPELEDMLQKMTPPQPKADPNAGKMQMEMQKMQMEMQARQGELSQEAELKKAEHSMKMQQMQMEMQKAQMEMKLAVAEHQMKLQQMQVQAQTAERTAMTQMQLGVQKHAVASEGLQLKQRAQQQAATAKPKASA